MGWLIMRDGREISVAVKRLRICTDQNLTQEKRAEIFRQQLQTLQIERGIMAKVGSHQNVLQLIGAVTRNPEDFCVITEYCAYGSLDRFLQDREAQEKFCDEVVTYGEDGYQLLKSDFHWKMQDDSTWNDQFENRRKDGIVTTSDLLWFAFQIAQALDFLNNKKSILHRDIALRNILLTDGYIVKIADFGLSRRTDDGTYQISSSTPLPVSYLAPETLQYEHFSKETEKWAFGITLWELFILAKFQPYVNECGINGTVDRWDISMFLGSGKRLTIPENTPNSM